MNKLRSKNVPEPSAEVLSQLTLIYSLIKSILALSIIYRYAKNSY